MNFSPLNLLDKLVGKYIDFRTEMRVRAMQIKDPEIKNLSYKDGKINGLVVSPIFAYLGQEGARMLDSNPACDNYLSLTIMPRIDEPQHRGIIVTIQYIDGLSPAQKATKLQAELDVLKADYADVSANSDLRLSVIEHMIAGITNVNYLDAAIDTVEILLREAGLNDLAKDLRSGEAATMAHLFGEDAGELSPVVDSVDGSDVTQE